MPQLTVDFSGQSHRSGPLSFGHANIVRSISVDEDPTRLNLAMVFDAPAAGGTARVADQLRRLFERHEALRTTYRLGPPVTQQVAAAGELAVPLVEAAAGEALDVAERTARRLRAEVFDLERELPVKAAVVTSGGVPRHLVWVVTHAAMDVAACEVLHTEWAALCADRPLPEPAALQPADVVGLEQSPTIQRLGRSALRYWESQLRRVPQAMFTPPARSTPPKTDWRHAGLDIRSTSVPAHLQTIADRTGASPSAVLLAALAVLVRHRTGHDTVVTTSLSDNRVVRKLRGFFGSLAQDALLPVDLSGAAGFDDVVRAVRSAGLPAYRHSWFDPTAIWQVINRVSTERGTSFARDLVFNDMSTLASNAQSPEQSARGRLPAVWIPGHQPPPEEDPELGGSVGWLPKEDIPCRFFACLYRLEGEFQLTLWVDPQILPQGVAEEFGRALLRLLRAAAGADLPLGELKTLTTLEPVRRGPGWYLSDHCWIELDAVRDLLDDVLGEVPHLVTVEPDDDLGHRIVCRLAGDDSPESVHEKVLAALPGRITAMAPHRYTVHDGAPAAGAGPDAWDALPVRAGSSGRAEGRDEA